MIPYEEIRATALRINEAATGRKGEAVAEWGEAREIDPDGLARFALEYAHSTVRALVAGDAGNLLEAIAGATLGGVQVGVELERRRRDREAMPL